MNNSHNVLEVQDVYVSFDGTDVLEGISLSIRRNERWAIIGPNGAGKSTLIKVISGFIRSLRGTVLLEGTHLHKYSPRKRALKMSYVPQKPDGMIPYTVHDFVMLGRYASMGFMMQPTEEDRKMVDEAVGICDIRHLMMRTMNTLSGGELQRVLLAGAVAQASPILLLDEPTTFLDPAHERLFFEAIERLHDSKELTTIMITHDINSAMFQCSHIMAMRKGKAVYKGATSEFKGRCPEILEDVFGIPFRQFVCEEKNDAIFGPWGGSCS